MGRRTTESDESAAVRCRQSTYYNAQYGKEADRQGMYSKTRTCGNLQLENGIRNTMLRIDKAPG